MTYNNHLGGLGGHGSLQMASKVKFETSNQKYPDIHVHIASDSHLGGLQMTLEVKTDIKIEMSNLKYHSNHVL